MDFFFANPFFLNWIKYTLNSDTFSQNTSVDLIRVKVTMAVRSMKRT